MNYALIFAFILMGFTSLTAQTLLIREFLITFYGNELTIGLILANWIVLVAAGSGLAGRISKRIRHPYTSYASLQIGISLYMPASIFLTRTIKDIMGLVAGEGVGVIPILTGSFFILAPLCILTGAEFPFGCRMLSDITAKRPDSVGRVYILEALGYILAGPIFTYILITKLNAFSIAFFLGSLNLVSAALLIIYAPKGRAKNILSIITVGLVILTSAAFLGPASAIQKFSIDREWKKQTVLSYINSIYGNLVATRSREQLNFYSNALPIITVPVPNLEFMEELVHFAMLGHSGPKNILLIGGGPGGMINEILKHPIDTLTYTELDPALITLVKKLPTELTKKEFGDSRLVIEYIDGRRFVAAAKDKYDCVIVNLPMPSTLQLNRLYTEEFFRKAAHILGERGILAFAGPGSLNYISPEMRKLNGTMLNTLEDAFGKKGCVNIIPGDYYNIYLASNNAFEVGAGIFGDRLEEKGIETKLLNRRYLEYRLDPERARWLKEELGDYTKIRKNYDLLPSGTFYSISYWNSLFSQNLTLAFRLLDRIRVWHIAATIAVMGFVLLLSKKYISEHAVFGAAFAISTTGFTGMALNLILIYAYQSFYGYVFNQLALLTAAFMAGIATGAYLVTRSLDNIKNPFLCLSRIEMAIFGFCVFIGFLLLYLSKTGETNLPFIILNLSAITGFLTGLEFPLAGKIYASDRPVSEAGGAIYAFDLAGSFAAALIVSVAFVPVIGVIPTCFILALIKSISLAFVIKK